MDGRLRPSGRAACFALGLAFIASCSDPFGFNPTPVEGEEEEICASSEEWLPSTPPLDQFNPLPHPATECPFYRGSWQQFLIATQPDAQGVPAFLSYPTIETLFQPAKPRAPTRSLLGNIKQAGGRQILLDQNGRPIFYGIHTNQAFADFVNRNNLRTREGIESADPNLFFPAGVVTFKSAWQEVAPNDPSNATYITVRTTVPRIRQIPGGAVEEDRNAPRETTVRLLALHVVFTLPGPPRVHLGHLRAQRWARPTRRPRTASATWPRTSTSIRTWPIPTTSGTARLSARTPTTCSAGRAPGPTRPTGPSPTRSCGSTIGPNPSRASRPRSTGCSPPRSRTAWSRMPP